MFKRNVPGWERALRAACGVTLVAVAAVLPVTGWPPTEARTFVTFNHAAERSDGAIPSRYRELIALGVAFTTQCAYCIDTHTRQARQAGATKQEIPEAAFVAAAVRAGGTLAHALLSLRLHDSPEK